MPYALSFAPDFFWGDGSIPPEEMQPRDRPTSVAQAIASLSEETWEALARDVFGVSGRVLDRATVLSKVIETNTCRNLDPPVEVWIDSEGSFSVLVYDPVDAAP